MCSKGISCLFFLVNTACFIHFCLKTSWVTTKKKNSTPDVNRGNRQLAADKTHVEDADLGALVVADLHLVLELDLEGERLQDHLADPDHHLCVRRLAERILRLQTGTQRSGYVSTTEMHGGAALPVSVPHKPAERREGSDSESSRHIDSTHYIHLC